MRATGGVYLGFYTSGGRKFLNGNFRTIRVLRSQNTDCRKNDSFSTVLYRVLPEQAGGDADVAAEAVDEVFLAVVAGGVGDLLDRERGRGEQILRLVDAA